MTVGPCVTQEYKQINIHAQCSIMVCVSFMQTKVKNIIHKSTNITKHLCIMFHKEMLCACCSCPHFSYFLMEHYGDPLADVAPLDVTPRHPEAPHGPENHQKAPLGSPNFHQKRVTKFCHPLLTQIVGSWTYLSLTFGRVCVYLYVYVHEVLDETLLLGHGICLYKVVKVHRIIMKVVVQRHCISYWTNQCSPTRGDQKKSKKKRKD